MARRESAAQDAPEQSERGEEVEQPPYYIATEALFTGPHARAHNAGDRVPVEHVEKYGWVDKVRRPDEDPSDDAAAPQNEPETRQATRKEGEA